MSEQIPVKNVTPPSQGDDARKARKIHTRAFTGLFRTVRMYVGFLLLLFLGTAWLNWDGRQAVWWNLPERKFYVFGATFWPQDFMLLSWLLIISAFALFFVTVYAKPCLVRLCRAHKPPGPGSSCGGKGYRR